MAGAEEYLELLRITADPANPSRGYMEAADRRLPVALGRGGIVSAKREGDGGTPAGTWPLRQLFYRADRTAMPRTALPVTAIGVRDGWSDDPADPDYNRFVLHPESGEREFSAERLWRGDGIYDLVAVIGYNDDPPRPGAGSAIFMHLARPDFSPTEGCVALQITDMEYVLPRIGPETRIGISAP